MATLIREVKNYEYKKNNRWILEFPENYGIDSYFVYSTSRPKFVRKDEVYAIEPMTIVLLDPIAPSTTQSVFKLTNEAVINYKLYLLDPTEVKVEEWELLECRIISIDFGNLSYEDDSVTKCTIVVQPSQVKLKF